MNVITWVKGRVRDRIANLVRVEIQRAMEDTLQLIPQLIEFQNSPKQERQCYYDRTKDPLGNIGFYETLKDRLLTAGAPVEEVDIDIFDFEHWLNNFSEIRKHYGNMGDAFIEKCMEHYLAFRHLKISDKDVYIDIAAAGSPWAEVLRAKGIRSYRLDLSYPAGIKGINIGANARNTNLPDGFATVLSLQCSYECFMGDADILFIKEANRILNEKGRYGIIPLYLNDAHINITSPYCDQRGIIIDSEAKKVWRDDKWRTPFGRDYSPESFIKRIYSIIPEGMIGRVLYFR